MVEGKTGTGAEDKWPSMVEIGDGWWEQIWLQASVKVHSNIREYINRGSRNCKQLPTYQGVAIQLLEALLCAGDSKSGKAHKNSTSNQGSEFCLSSFQHSPSKYLFSILHLLSNFWLSSHHPAPVQQYCIFVWCRPCQLVPPYCCRAWINDISNEGISYCWTFDNPLANSGSQTKVESHAKSAVTCMKMTSKLIVSLVDTKLCSLVCCSFSNPTPIPYSAWFPDPHTSDDTKANAQHQLYQLGGEY